MRIRTLVEIIGTAVAAAGIGTYVQYRRDVRAIRYALKSTSKVVETRLGPIEYAEAGQGEPVLLIHGAGGGYDQGLLVGRDLGDGFRIIAPSRFGYLRTPVPDDASPTAQAKAHAALLEYLCIKKCIVVGVSAGAPSAIELALHYPDSVSELVLLVPRTYDPTQAIGVDDAFESQMVLRLVEGSSDFLFWLAMRFARSSVVRFLGVRPELEASALEADRARATEVMRSLLPLSSRVRGIVIDSSTEISSWPLERIRMPVLIVSAKDDLFNTLPGARFTAEHISGAELKILESGGHLMLGNGEQVREWLTEFLARDRTPRMASSLGGKTKTVAAAQAA